MVNGRFHFRQYIPIFALLNLAISGTLCVYSVMAYLGLKFTFSIGFICACIILGIYSFNRFTDLIEDLSNNTSRVIFVMYKSVLMPISIMLIIISIISLVVSGKINQYHLVLVTLGIMYSFPLIPWFKQNKGLHFIRLKQLPFVKNLFVSLLWGFSIVLIPILYTNMKVVNIFPIALLISSQIIATLSNTLFSDIRDVTGDKFAGNLTLPVLLGESFSLKVIYVISIGWFSLLTYLSVSGAIDLWHYLFFILILIYTPVCILLFKLRIFSYEMINLLSDFDLLLFAAGIKMLSLV